MDISLYNKGFSAYVRKSRMDPNNESVEETLSRHKRTLLQFAKTNNITITAFYEEVVSGDGLFVRPEMIRLLSDVEQGKYAGVLCMDIDRLGRVDTRDRGIILETFKASHTLILTPRKIYDLDDDIDEFSTEMQMLIARQELKKITQRLQAGSRRTIEDGGHTWEPPFGYRRVYIDKKPTLEIHEEEANLVRMIFDMYVNQGYGSYTIADTINTMGYKTRKNTKFSRNTVRFFLQNPIYIGKIVWNKRHHIKKKHPEDKFRSELNPQSDWVVVDGIHPAIIDEDIFNKAQEIRKSRSHPPSYTGKIKNPFAGLIRCKNCGQLMSRQTNPKTGPRLLCVNNGCNKSITIDKVEIAVLNALEDILHDFDFKTATKESKEQKREFEIISKEITNIKKQIATLRTQKNNLHDLLEQGVYDIKTFTERGAHITSEIGKAEVLLQQYTQKIEDFSNYPKKKEIIPTIRYIVDNYDDLSAAEKNTLLKKVVDHIDYRREKKPGSDFEVSISLKKWM